MVGSEIGWQVVLASRLASRYGSHPQHVFVESHDKQNMKNLRDDRVEASPRSNLLSSVAVFPGLTHVAIG